MPPGCWPLVGCVTPVAILLCKFSEHMVGFRNWFWVIRIIWEKYISMVFSAEMLWVLDEDLVGTEILNPSTGMFVIHCPSAPYVSIIPKQPFDPAVYSFSGR